MLSTIPCSGFLYLQFLARCHPYILFRFLHLFHSFFPHREHLHNIEGCRVWDGWISTRISGYRSRYIIIRSCARYISENTHARNPTRDSRNGVAYCGNFRISQGRLLKGTNCPFASKDHARPVSKRLCIIFMACARSFKEEEEEETEEEEDGENRGFSVFRIL